MKKFDFKRQLLLVTAETKFCSSKLNCRVTRFFASWPYKLSESAINKVTVELRYSNLRYNNNFAIVTFIKSSKYIPTMQNHFVIITLRYNNLFSIHHGMLLYRSLTVHGDIAER